ncbi:hypothetical protein MT391_18025 [Vibrio sp. 1-Bac 57]
MKTYRTSAQWQQPLQQSNDFSGTNIQFCQHHRISISNYYKHRALRVEKLPKQPVSIQTAGGLDAITTCLSNSKRVISEIENIAILPHS